MPQPPPQNAVERALKWLPVLFIGFFVLSALRGYVQPQWVIVAVFGLVYTLFTYARRHPRTRRYVVRAGVVVICLMVLLRLEMIFNPLGIRFEVFDNPQSYGTIADIADGRPVVFRHGYATAAKYRFYTGEDAYCQPNIRYRTHQWQFRDDDSRFAGREVLIETSAADATDTTHRVRSVQLANGKWFTWMVDANFQPLRRVDITFEGLPAEVTRGEELCLHLRIENPYPYVIEVGDEVTLVMLWKQGRFRVEEFPVEVCCQLPAGGASVADVAFTIPDALADAGFDVGFALRREGYTNWFNGKSLPTEVLK